MKNLRVNLMVDDVNATVAYYRDVFDAEVLATVPETGAFDFALVRMGSVELMFEAAKSLSEGIPSLKDKPLGGTFTLYIDVDDVVDLYKKVKANVETVKDLHDTFYGTKEFYMADCNGYLIAFAQKL